MKRFSILLSFLLPVAAQAVLPEIPQPKTGIGLFAVRDTEQYRLGDEWGKRPLRVEDLSGELPSVRRAALATASVGGATGFYLGKFAGKHVLATNHHVMESEWGCNGRTIRFPLLGVRGRCREMLGTWNNIDLTLFTAEFEGAEDEAKLAAVAGNFLFHGDVQPGQDLLTVGFGVAGNTMRRPMVNTDSDCFVFSGSGEYRLMADPDALNPGPDRVWSFALGCDCSHGDSGSAIVDRRTGDVVGIIWTGRIPKTEQAGKSRFLREIFESRSESIWTELTYAVPAKKIGEVLTAGLSSLPEAKRVVVQELLR
jgi:hypothetical protein